MFGLSGLTSILIGAAAIALVSGGTAGWAMHHWDQVRYLKLENSIAQGVIDAQNAAKAQQAKQDKVSHDVDVENAREQQRIQIVTRNIIQKVPVYVTEKQNAACVLPWSVIKLLDGAGTQTDPDALPGAASELNDSASGIPLSRATALLATNLGDAAANRQQLKSLEEWVAKQEATSP